MTDERGRLLVGEGVEEDTYISGLRPEKLTAEDHARSHFVMQHVSWRDILL